MNNKIFLYLNFNYDIYNLNILKLYLYIFFNILLIFNRKKNNFKFLNANQPGFAPYVALKYI